VKQENRSKAATWFASLATGPKMLLILGLALLPLGVIAILASLDAARATRANVAVEAQSVLSLASQRLSSAITRAGVAVRVASGAVSDADPAAASRACERAAAQLSEREESPVRFSLYGPGNRLVCQTEGFRPAALPLLPPSGTLSVVRVDPQGRHLSLTLFDSNGAAQGQIEMPAAMVTEATHPGNPPIPLELDLVGEGGTMKLFDGFNEAAFQREVMLTEALLSDRLQLRLLAAAKELSAGEIIMILLPVLMWLFACIIGWLIVDRLLLRPLGAMQKAISGYRPGDKSVELPKSRSPAREITALGNAFEQVTRTVARHESELEEAVERQTRLVREVHHRVKNNLQVVASLLNIHSRGSSSEEVAAAYASIQRRVDALAVVHRNHYAELEKTPGVALKALISELGASLRASAPAGAAKMQVRLALEPLYSNQDVAVSVAFLITEVVEFGMLCGSTLVTITLEGEDEEGRARLTLESDSLTDNPKCPPDLQDRFERIIAGLARQLRSTPDRDMEQGRFSLTIAVVGRDEG
jgi:two-component sensor histidine kinase